MYVHLRPLFEQYATLLRPAKLRAVGGSGFSGAEIFRGATPLGEFALRCWPAEHPTSGHIRTVHRLLAKAFESGCTFVPVPVPDLHGETLIEFAGRRWQLEPWMPGTPDLAPQANPHHVDAAFQALAQLHTALAGDGSTPQTAEESPALLERIRVLEACLEGDINRAWTALRDEPDAAWRERGRRYFKLFDEAVGPTYRLLKRAAETTYYQQPVVRDVHREHILFTDDDAETQVTGLVDFGAATVDHPALDWARLLGSYAIDDASRRKQLLDAHSPMFTDEERLLVEAFDKSGALLSPFRWLWWLFVERRTYRDPAAVAARFDVLLQRLTRLVDDTSPGGELWLPT